MKRLFEWLDHRTGCKQIASEALYENIPGGSRWRYVWGSTLVFCLFIQFVTGIFLWMSYAPSAQTAWESVYYIQHEMAGGWLLRGLHHYTAQAMTILLVLHLMQVVIDGAYRAPREINFWVGLVLLFLVMALSLTGYLLPWDQKGYWATKVTTNLIGLTPLIGPGLQKLLVGGTEYGHHTLTRFFALHAGVLPGLIVVLLAGHIYLFRRHGLTPKKPLRKPDEKFWPDQMLRDSVACLAVLGAVLFLIAWPRLMNAEAALGAPLGAPADPAEAYSAARPEWYFLFLFQFLKYFPGRTEVIGAILLPGLVAALLFLMPFIGNWKLGHRFNLLFLGILLGGAGFLTLLAFRQDEQDPHFQLARRQAAEQADRIVVLAQSPTGIPQSGALALLRTDPLTQGPKLFSRHCSSCHHFDGHDGLGEVPPEPSSAPDLKGFASRSWLEGFFDPELISSHRYFAGSAFENGRMARFVKREVAGFDEEERAMLDGVILALSAEAALPSQREVDARDELLIAEGRVFLANEQMRCIDCHSFHQHDEEGMGPDLTGYGSRQWLIEMISNPAHERFYGKRNDRMPAFGEEQILAREEIELLADWIREDWYRPKMQAR
jgi:ubiquinol-cytochrome c reductase cytochrome b subunit